MFLLLNLFTPVFSSESYSGLKAKVVATHVFLYAFSRGQRKSVFGCLNISFYGIKTDVKQARTSQWKRLQRAEDIEEQETKILKEFSPLTDRHSTQIHKRAE